MTESILFQSYLLKITELNSDHISSRFIREGELRYTALKPTESYNQHYIPLAYIWKH